MEYVNKQLNLKLGAYDFNLKQQLGEMMEQYKNYLTQDKPIYKNPEEEQVVENLLSELQNVNEEDLQLDDTTQLTRQLETIQEEIINEEHVVETEEVNEALDNMIKDIEEPELKNLNVDFEQYSNLDEEVEEIAEEITEEELTDEEIANLVSADDFANIVPSGDDDDDLPFISDDEEEEEEVEEYVEDEEDVEEYVEEEEVEEVEEEVVEEEVVEEEVDDLDDFIIEEKKIVEDRCNKIMGRGKRKGEACGKKVHQDGKCKKHFK